MCHAGVRIPGPLSPVLASVDWCDGCCDSRVLENDRSRWGAPLVAASALLFGPVD